MTSKHNVLVNTLNILSESKDIKSFLVLTENAEKIDIGKVKAKRLFALAPVKDVQEICTVKGISITIMENMADGLATNLGRAGVDIEQPLNKDVLISAKKNLKVKTGPDIVLETISQPFIPAAYAVTSIIPTTPLSLFAAILDPMTFSEWLEIYQQVMKTGSYLLGDETITAWSNNVRQGCFLAVKCRTKTKLVKNLVENKKTKRGSTRYVPKAVLDYGTWSGFGDIGGCYVTITLNFEILLNLAKVNKAFEEENVKVKAERKNAGKRFSFKKLPLKFILLHEQMHRDDACRDLARIARKGLTCDITDFTP